MARKQTSGNDRNLIVQFLLVSSKNGKPEHGRMKEAMVKWDLSKSTIYRLWKSARKQEAEGQAMISVSGHKTRKKVIKHTPDPGKIKALHLRDRTSYERMGAALGISPSTLCRWKKIGIFRPHTSAIHPNLTADNKFLRVRFSLESLELDRIMNKLQFQNMNNIVHIDEKWFYITKGSNRYYITADEDEPYRATQSKKFIGKIMFICAVSRPILNSDGSVLFDGKIRIFPFTKQVQAKRKSRKRAKGTWETKAIDSVTREVIRDTIIQKVLPAIRTKWPQNASKTIYIQQDNAKPHITDSDPEFRAEAVKEGFNMILIQQPANSPDCNVNDLGWFNAIQSLQQKKVCKTVDDLVNAVVQSFHQLEPQTLNKVFLSLQSVLIEIMKAKGHNNFKLPHVKKDALIRQGQLPNVLEVPLDLAMECIQFLIENGQINGIQALKSRLGLMQITGIL